MKVARGSMCSAISLGRSLCPMYVLRASMNVEAEQAEDHFQKWTIALRPSG